jgi:putative hydrolase of the HAD superfamily
LAEQAPIEALVFDMGGVLVDIDFQRAFRAWARAAAVPPDAIAARYVVDDACFAHERGELDDAGYFAHLRRLLGIDVPDADMLAGWNALIGDPVPGIDLLVRRLAAQWPLYVFSNTNPAHIAHFTPRLRDLFAHFRAVFTSCEIGRRKPEAEAFARVAARIGVPPARLLFFDDVQANVEGARRAGLQAFRVTQPREIEAIVDQKRSAR